MTWRPGLGNDSQISFNFTTGGAFGPDKSLLVNDLVVFCCRGLIIKHDKFSLKTNHWVVVSNIFLFSPLFGEDYHFD